jgi:tRNA A37 threonylcarbamoyladenosine synthetase subunit TsaC/SUA5/YrdC
MPSTIVDLTNDAGDWRLLRRGAIPAEKIVEVLGQE